MAQGGDFPVYIKKMLDKTNDDPLLKCQLKKDDHGCIMSRIGDELETSYVKLGNELQIPRKKIQAIEEDRNNGWRKLNDITYEWLKWNYNKKLRDEYNLRPNKRWLVEAIKVVDAEFGSELEKEYTDALSTTTEQTDTREQEESEGQMEVALNIN